MLDLSLPALIHAYGLWVLFAMVFLESAGVPLPGETVLISAALYAGSTHRFTLAAVIAVAFAAAVSGDTLGYAIGRTLGTSALARYGRHVGLTGQRLATGERLFRRHGGKIVFFGRFVALLRVLVALLAGANHMPWPRFAAMNALGGLAWASLFAGAAYAYGDRVRRVEGPLAMAMLGAALLAVLVGALLARRYEARIAGRADEG
jgi:membrane protein DedA with SNARE-associated domain